jgi:RNA polymerase sigma-70 factor (ECF subfamily)
MTDDRFTALYERYGSTIYRLCRRMLADNAAAEDATQETFIRVYRHLDRSPDPQQALGWIYRIATNYCLNEIRNRKLRPRPAAVLPEGLSQDVEALLGDQDFVARLLSSAPTKVRTVAWLYHVERMVLPEVADALGLSRRTVIRRLGHFATFARKFAARPGGV